VVPGDLAAGKEPNQGHITQGAPHNLQLGTEPTKVWATPA
jgi:hypothetical protein